MKIIWITSLFPSGANSTKGIYLYRTVKKLSEKYDITTIVVYPSIPPILQILEKPFQARKTYNYWKKNFPKNPTPPKAISPSKIFYVRYLRTPRRFSNHLEGYFAYFKVWSILKKILRSDSVIHSNWIFPSGQLAYLINKKYKVPYLVSLLGTDVHKLSYGTSYWKKAKKILNNSTAITSVSRQLINKCKDEKIQFEEKKIFYIDNIYDEHKFSIKNQSAIRNKLNLPQNRKIIFFAGGLVKVKNVSLLVDAFNELRQNNSNIELILAGAGIEKNNLHKKTVNLGCEEAVSFVGNLSENQLIEYYNAADIFCLPSINEGTPNVIIEALLCGIPVVASNVGGIPDLILNDKNGYIFNSGDMTDLKNKLSMTLAKKWEREEIRKSISRYFSNNVLKKYHDIYTFLSRGI